MKYSNPDITSRSYSPYSHRLVSCYIRGASGTIYQGVRVENVSFPLTIPAVQAAISSCLGNQDKPVEILQDSNKDSLSNLWIQKFDLKKAERFPEDSLIYNPLLKEVDNIQDTLKDLCEITVSSISNFPVTALLKTSGGYIPGVNIEFDEWNLGLCAERLALSRALAAGYTDFKGMHIYAPKSDYISPCGACRQVLYELMPDQTLALHHDIESTTRHIVSHLLPNGFTTNSLKK